MIETTMALSDNPTNVESKDTALLDNDSTEVSTVLFSVSAEMSTTSDNQLYSHTRAEVSGSVCASSVIFSLSQTEASDEHQLKSVSSPVDDAMYACSIVDDDNVETEDDSLISQSISSSAGNDGITDDYEEMKRGGELKTMQLVSLRCFTVL